MHFAKRLSFLITAGVPILESVHILKEQSRGRRAARLYDRLIRDIAEGQYLHTSLKKLKVFSDYVLNIIRVGELSGTLAKNLIYLAQELEKRDALRRKIIGATFYPVVISIATLGLTGLLTVYIFPKIMPIFISLNVELPLTTRVLLALSQFLSTHGLTFIGILVVIGVGVYALIRANREIRFWAHWLTLRIPLFGPTSQAYTMANACRTLSLLLRSGMLVTSALEVVAASTTNEVYAREFALIRTRAETGESLSRAIRNRGTRFPILVGHMVAIGERTGTLTESLGYLAELYEGEVDDITKNLSSVLEPVLMIVMGVVVGLVAVSVITPIYAITQKLTR
jgi:type IV pilus assembly protein PilC